MKIIFATHNAHKIKEIRSVIGEKYDIISLNEIGCKEEIPETGQTIEENALLKAAYVWRKYQAPCFADDTGLEVDVLNGLPGVRSARYAGEECNAEANMDLLLSELNGNQNRSAQFKTVITLILNSEPKQFTGIIKGKITTGKKGAGDFGYDPIFIPEGYDQTFAEMPTIEKNKISHRALALQEMTNYLNL